MFKGSHRLGNNWAERVMLEGMSTKSAVELRPLAKSWLEAPKVKDLNGAAGGEYDMAQRAYQFDLQEDQREFNFSIAASNKSPIENLCFVVRKWDSDQAAIVKLNGAEVNDSEIRQGIVLDTDGLQTLVVYLKISVEKSVNFTISK